MFKNRKGNHFLFAVFWIGKSCAFYVFIEEILKLALRPEFDGLVLFDSFQLQLFWFIAAGLLIVGQFLDILMLVFSLFFRRVAMALIFISLLVHSIGIVPQQITGAYLAVKFNDWNASQIPWKSQFQDLEAACTKFTHDHRPQGVWNDTSDLQKAMKPVAEHQHSLMCCGWESANDWDRYCKNVTKTSGTVIRWWADSTNLDLPPSCCVHQTKKANNTHCSVDSGDKWAESGCKQATQGLIKRVLMVFGFMILFIELVSYVASVLFFLFVSYKPMPKNLVVKDGNEPKSDAPNKSRVVALPVSSAMNSSKMKSSKVEN
ncbi:hypothetical protein M3Y94_00705000 [Aphelenchoides besseyi]|nr:hypothetical protein M3Y94_00705000 [Aphelenchoides besseyi]